MKEDTLLERMAKVVVQAGALARRKALSSGVHVKGSNDLLQQVWLNLLDNAIKFSNDEGTLHIMMIETEQFVSVIIKDEGVGMPQDQINQVFRKFYQTDEGKERGGNGLGLSVVKRIIELHKGSISIESKISQGTSITVSLPKNKG